MKTYKNYKLLALSSLLIGNASAQVIIQNDFNGLTVDAGDVGTAIQLVSNSIGGPGTVSYTHLRAHETKANLVCRLLLEKKK